MRLSSECFLNKAGYRRPFEKRAASISLQIRFRALSPAILLADSVQASTVNRLAFSAGAGIILARCGRAGVGRGEILRSAQNDNRGRLGRPDPSAALRARGHRYMSGRERHRGRRVARWTGWKTASGLKTRATLGAGGGPFGCAQDAHHARQPARRAGHLICSRETGVRYSTFIMWNLVPRNSEYEGYTQLHECDIHAA